MLYINNPQALLAIENDRRRELGMRTTSVADTTAANVAAQEGIRARTFRSGFRGLASVRYAAS